MKTVQILLLILTAVIIIPASSSAQGLARQSGTVTDTEGNPLQGVTVSIEGTDEQAITDEEGRFIFTRLEIPRRYVFTFQLEGYNPHKLQKEITERLTNRAIEVTLEKISLSPEQRAYQYYEEGSALMRERKFSEALELFKQAIELSPEQNAYRFNAGVCLYFMQKYDEALEYIEPTMEEFGNNPTALTLAADTHLFERNYQQAVEYYETLGEIQELDAGSQINLGYAYHGINKPEKALELLNQVLEARPGDVDALQRKAVILIEMEEYDGAIHALEGIHASHGDRMDKSLLDTLVSLLDEQGTAKLEAGDTEAALPYFEKIIAVAPESEEAENARLVIKTAAELDQ